MQRGVKVEQVQWAARAAKRHGIQVGMFLMWGYDGERLEDIEATIDHVKQCSPDVHLTTVAYPIKNTAYFKKTSDLVVLERDWAESTDRDYKIRGRHSRRYYKFADQWLNNEVAAASIEHQDAAGAALKRMAAQQAKEAMMGAAAELEA